MKTLMTFLLVWFSVWTFSAASAQQEARVNSGLWGESGEAWDPAGRLPDFSYAGYGRGERAIPEFPRGVSVRDFGARGDGQTDDTRAFQRALEEVASGAVEVPPGRYVITDFLEIKRSGTLLRGADPKDTILVFPKPLNDIKPNWGATTTGEKTSNYSWSGGFVVIRGSLQSRPLAQIVQPAKRGSREIVVARTESPKVGQEIEIFQQDNPDNSLAVHLYSGDSGPVSELKGRARTSLVTRIVAIEGNTITFDRALRCDIETRWNPRVQSFNPTVTESGVENLGFEFPVTAYGGHFSELGFNPAALIGVAHCWIRNIRIAHADSGPFVSGVFNTIEGIVFESDRPLDRQQCTGHHGISLGGGDNLVARFDIGTRFIHDITVSGFCSGNVVMNGRGVDLSLDHHRKAPYANLFTDLDAGAGSRLWKCGGGAALGKNCGAWGTFWRIRSANPLAYPPERFGPPTLNLVALETDQRPVADPNGKWFETMDPDIIHPTNLYLAQKEKRLGH